MNSSSLRSDPTEEAGVSNGRTTMSVLAEAYYAPQLTLSTVQDGISALGKAYALHPVSQKSPNLTLPLKRFPNVRLTGDGPLKKLGSSSASSFNASLLQANSQWRDVLGFVPRR